MTPENSRLIRERILKASLILEGKLPDHPSHPKGRNPYAHIPKVIKDMCGGLSYKDMPDEAFDHIINLIEYCENNPF